MILDAKNWPPSFTLDQERILNLLTGDRFYSNPSAALREAVLNSIDAVYRRRRSESELVPNIKVTFNDAEHTLTVADNGVGMSRIDVSALFTKVGVSAATTEANQKSVGEFGIGVISYFMAGDVFELQTNDGETESVGLSFDKAILAGGGAAELPPTQKSRGTTVTIKTRDAETFELLVKYFKHWCRAVEGLSALVEPGNRTLSQGVSCRPGNTVDVQHPEWVECAHLGPTADPIGWDAMTGKSSVAILYRGVFVQQFEVEGAWGIEGSLDVDPKHFKPRLNREAFVDDNFQTEMESFLRRCHPAILEAMATHLAAAAKSGALDKWTEKRWANLWLSVPRDAAYASAVKAWDDIFRSLPAFECAKGSKWEAISMEQLKNLGSEIFLAPLADERFNDVVKAALHWLRNTGSPVIRGIRRDESWMKFAPASYGTTAQLISEVFANELPPLNPITPQRAQSILGAIECTAQLFTGPPPVDLVRLGAGSPPALRLKKRLVINIDHPDGKAIVEEALHQNCGRRSLIAIAAKHAYQQLTEIAAAVRDDEESEILSPVRRRFIRSHLS